MQHGQLLDPRSSLPPWGAHLSGCTCRLVQDPLAPACQGDASCPGRSVPPLGFSQHLPGLGRCPTLGASGEEPPGSAGACRPFTPPPQPPVLPSCPTHVRDQEPKAGAGADLHLQARLCLFRWYDTLSCIPFQPSIHLGSHCPQRRACCAVPAVSWPAAGLASGNPAACCNPAAVGEPRSGGACVFLCRCHLCARPRSDFCLCPFPLVSVSRQRVCGQRPSAPACGLFINIVRLCRQELRLGVCGLGVFPFK